jgi:hypothetical protein
MKKNSKVLEWFQNELTKDKIELDKTKSDLIKQITKLNKEEILPKIPKTPEKISLWKRIKKVLMG